MITNKLKVVSNNLLRATLILSFLVYSFANAQTSTSSPSTIGKYEVFEITITHDQTPYSNVWEDVIPQVNFQSPSGQNITVEGFYYDVDTWKVRFAPWETGSYTWNLTIDTYTENGSFNCTPSNEKGFIRQHPDNPYRLIYEQDSSLFTGLGWGNGVGPNPLDPDEMIGDSSVMGWWSSETDTTDISYFIAEVGGYSLQEYLDSMVGVGQLNFFRWSVANGGWAAWDIVAPSGNTYNVTKGKWGDDYVKALRNRGVRILFDPIGFGWQNHPGFTYQPINLQDRDAVKRYYSYVIARWGAYVDIYEFFNEQVASNNWMNEMATHINNVDPYGRMVSVSWSRADHADIDVNCPHVYYSTDLMNADLSVQDVVDNGWSVEGGLPKLDYPKPLIFGEAGENFGALSEDPQRPYTNRVKAWVGFFLEAHSLFWEQNWNHLVGGGIYFGPQVRQYFGAHQTYAKQVSADVNISSTSVVSGGVQGNRFYELTTNSDLYLYIFCPTNQTLPPVTNDITANISVPQDGMAYWYNTSDGSIIDSFQVNMGDTSIAAPNFELDIALMIKGESNNTAGLTSQIVNPVTIYPNPSSGLFYGELSQNQKNINMVIHDMSGREIMERKIHNHNFKIDMSSFENGVYFLNYIVNDKQYTKKLIISD